MSNKSSTESTQTGFQSGTSTSAPWGPTQPLLSDILTQIGGPGMQAVTDMSGVAGDFAKQYGPAFENVAGSMLTGGPDRRGNLTNAYTVLSDELTPTIGGHYLDPNTNPFFAKTTSDISSDVEERLRSMYAGSGRDAPGAGNYGKTVGEGVAKAVAPIYAGVYNTERGRQEQAFRDLFGAGTSMVGTLSNMDKDILRTQTGGLDVARAAQQFGLSPYETLLSGLGSLVGLTTPIASLGGTKVSSGTGTSTGSTEKSPSIFETLSQIGNLFG